MTGGAHPDVRWAPTPPRRRRRRRVGIIIAVIVVVLALVATGILLLAPRSAEAPPLGAQAPKAGDVFFTPTDSAAAEAAAPALTDGATPNGDSPDDETSLDPGTAAAAYLAAQPTAVWLTPERDPLDVVEQHVRTLLAEARAQDATLTLVVYGLPGRDCGQHSAGGLSAEEYPLWTTAIGDALRAENVDDASAGVPTVVIIEPDSLALAPQCGNVDERVAQLTSAVPTLQAPHTWLYLDGGHSNWLPAAEMAGLISQVATAQQVRGFATNVSNYNSAADEFDYAHALSAALGGMHAVIDTSRSGAGSNGEWCNPPGRLIGEVAGTFGDDVVDTNLWIKVPGESDGECNGGPPAGQWWPASAIELTRNVVG